MNASIETLATLLNFHLDRFGSLGALIAIEESEAGRRLVDRILSGARLKSDTIARRECECAVCVEERAGTPAARASAACVNPRNPKDKGTLEAAHTHVGHQRSTR